MSGGGPGGFMGDMMGAAGCDGQGNALVQGMRKMMAEGGVGPSAMHFDPSVDDLPPEELAMRHGMEAAWHEEFMAHNAFERAASSSAAPIESTAMVEEFLQREAHASQLHTQDNWAAEMAAQQENDWAAQFAERQANGEGWAEEFLEDGVQTFGVVGEEPMTFEEKQANSEFFKFLNKVKEHEIDLDEGKDQKWAEEYTGNTWAQEFQAEETAGTVDPLEAAWQNVEGETGAEWAQQMMSENWVNQFNAERTGQEDDWASDFMRSVPDYPFTENNPYLYHENPYQEGLDLLAAGTLAQAVLAFEAAVQKDPDFAKGWEHLGITQAENEKDFHAIAALSHCRKLEPENQKVLMQLGVSFTNESKYAEAIDALQSWLLSNPAFKGVADQLSNVQVDDDTSDYVQEYYFINPKQHKKVTRMFEMSLGIQPLEDVHIGLGVLYNMSHEYDKAVTHISKALESRPQDAQLYNKLGATLANSNRSGEAIKAYNKALDINPGFVRAQYNLGIAYSNLGEHRQAAQQFLQAIEMQGDTHSSGAGGSSELWDILRMTFTLMNRQDLVEKTWTKDVALFASEFLS